MGVCECQGIQSNNVFFAPFAGFLAIFAVTASSVLEAKGKIFNRKER
jgi:hypothetical protein